MTKASEGARFFLLLLRIKSKISAEEFREFLKE